MSHDNHDLQFAKILLEKAEGKRRVFTGNQLELIRDQGLKRQRVYELAYRYGSPGMGIIKALEEGREKHRK